MVQRYQKQISEASAPNAFAQNFVDGAATGAQVAGAFAGLGDEVRRFADVQKRRNDEYDATRVMDAQNEFNRGMTEYLDDPDTGVVNSRQLGGARGATADTDKYADELAERIAGALDNDAQRNAFFRISQQARLPFWKRASEFEAGQTKKYRGQVFQTTLDQGEQTVQRVPQDDFAFESAAQQGAAVIRSQYHGQDPETVDAAVREYAADLERRRIEAVGEKDPGRAAGMAAKAVYLRPETGLELGEKYRIIETRNTDRARIVTLLNTYGPDEAPKFIRELLKDNPEEQRKELEAEARILVDDAKVRRGSEEAERREKHNETMARLLREEVFKGRIPGPEEADTLVKSGELSEKDAIWLKEVRHRYAERLGAELKVRERKGPEIISPSDFESAVARERGIGEKERHEAYADAFRRMADGTLDSKQLVQLNVEGRLSDSEACRLNELAGILTEEQQEFWKYEIDKLDRMLLRTELPEENGPSVRDSFYRAGSKLDPESPSYERDLAEVRRDILLAALTDRDILLDMPQNGGGRVNPHIYPVGIERWR